MSRLFETRPEDDGLPGRERWLAVLALITGTSMAVIDATMINIALPSIGHDLGIDASRSVWVVSLFQVVCAACLLLCASLSELVSRRRLYLAGLALFTLAALGAGLSTSFEMLLACRALQGVGAAATLSIGPSLYRLIFPSRLLGSAMGLSALVVAGGYAAGPTLGGLVLAVADWPWLFALNVPLGGVAWMLAYRALPAEPRRRGGFDALGAALSAVALASAFLAMDGLGHGAGVARVTSLMVVSLLAGGLFLRRQRRARYPLLPLAMFAVPRFSLALIVSGLAFVAQGLAFVALSFLYQQQMGYSPLETAWLFTPWPLTIMLAAPLAGRLADRINPAVLSTLGLAILLVGLACLALLPDEASILDSLWRTALCGLGFGLFQAPNNREVMLNVSQTRSANASGMLSTTRTIGQSLGVALVGLFLATRLDDVQASLWIACLACALSLAVSLRRIPLAAEPLQAASPRPD